MKKILWFMMVWSAQGAYAQTTARLQFRSNNAAPDTLVAYLTENSIIRKTETIRLPLKRGQADTIISLQQPAHVWLKVAGQEFAGILEPGGGLVGGRVATELLTFKNQLNRNKHEGQKALVARSLGQTNPYAFLFMFADSAERALSQHLSADRPLLSKPAWRALDADIKATFLMLRYNLPTYVAHESPGVLRAKGILPPLGFADSLAYSDTYAETVYTILFKEYADRTMVDNRHILTEKYRFVDSLLPGQLRLPVVTLFLESDLAGLNQGEELEDIRQKEYRGNGNSIYAQYIAARLGSLFKTGVPAPGFNLEGLNGEQVSLADLRGKVVYLDFWFTECMPCRALYERLKPVREHFKADSQVVFLSISIDDKKKWMEGLNLLGMEGLAAYTGGLREKHPVISDYKVASYPTTTLIDKKGRIFLATPSDVPNELIRQIEGALKAN